MSAVEEARQRPVVARRVAAWPGQVLHSALGFGVAVIAMLLVCASALTWRLAQGPLDVLWLVRKLEAWQIPADAPTHLAIGGATVAWNGFAGGADSGLELRLTDLQVVDRSGQTDARADQVEATLSLLRLFELRVAPRSVSLAGLRLRGVRAADGAIKLDLGALGDNGQGADDGGASLSDVLAELRRPAGTDHGHQSAGLDAFTQMRHVRVRDAEVELDDQASGATLRGKIASLDLQRMDAGGVKGEANGQLGLGEAMATLALQADLLADGGTHLALSLAPLGTASVAQANPALASIGALDASIQGRATLDLSPALLPRQGELHASTGNGTLSLPGSKVALQRLGLDLTAQWGGTSWRPEQVALQRAEAVLLPPGGGKSSTLAATGTAAHQDGKLQAKLDISLDQVAFADLPSLWPAVLGGNVRPWLAANVTAGTAHDGAVNLTLSAPDDNLAALAVTEAGGTLRADDVTVNWLRPVPPVEHLQAVLKVVSPDVIEITMPTASQGSIALKNSLLRFTGLAGKDQFMALTTNIQGSVPDTLTLLSNPRLRLLSKHPLPIKSSSGTIASKLSVELPLLKNLNADQVKIAAQGKLSALRLTGVVAGRDLDRGDIQFDVTQDGLKATGNANVAGIAGAVEVDMDFRSGPPDQVLQHATVSGRVTPAQLVATGADPGGLITSGYAVIDTSYTAQRNGSSEVDISADLSAAGMSLLGWRKAPGPKASASAKILLDHDKLAGVSDLHAEGPDLALVGRAEMVGDRPLLLHLDKVVLGPTQASGDVRFPENAGAPIRVQIAGAELDLSTELNAKPGRSNGENAPAWIADIHFDRVLLVKGKPLIGVTAHAEHDGRRLKVLRLSSTGPERVQASIEPAGVGRKLSVRAADAGALLTALDVTSTVHGGALALEGQYDDRDADPPLAGTLDVRNFNVHDAVAIGKLLQAVTIYGIADALRGEGVQFTRLVLPFRFERNVLRVGESRAYSASLGLTAHGWIDLNRNLMDLRGTVVPAYALNSALGKIPLVGRLFSPEHGGGLVAVNYSVTGKTTDPNVSVNPLSALTPGFLRGLFNIFS